jgi:large subunit ribosomal protein L21
MYTVFEIKSKKGGARQIDVDKINQLIQIDYQKNTKPGDKIIFDKVLSCDEVEEEFGQPYLKNVQVIGEVIKHGKRKKIIIYKYKAKKRYKKKRGHRQQYTQIKITQIAKSTSSQ